MALSVGCVPPDSTAAAAPATNGGGPAGPAPVRRSAGSRFAVYRSRHPLDCRYSCQSASLGSSHLRLSLIHISEPTRLGMISYAVFCLKKKKKKKYTYQ